MSESTQAVAVTKRKVSATTVEAAGKKAMAAKEWSATTLGWLMKAKEREHHAQQVYDNAVRLETEKQAQYAQVEDDFLTQVDEAEVTDADTTVAQG